MRRFMRDNRVKHYFLCNAYPRKAIVTVSRADDIRPYSGDRTGMVLTTPYRAKLHIADLVVVFGNVRVVRLSVSRIIAGLSAVGTLLLSLIHI